MQQPTEKGRLTKQEQYFTERWPRHTIYYEKLSARNKLWHQSLLTFTVIGSIAVPILLNVPGIPKWIPTVLSGLVAAAAALGNVYRFGDNWRNFRQTLEALERERALFDTEVWPYEDPQVAFNRFVTRVEDIVASETARYFPDEEHKPRTDTKF
jgi:ABC-type multidrug transport system fused ATPase/permease subunit